MGSHRMGGQANLHRWIEQDRAPRKAANPNRSALARDRKGVASTVGGSTGRSRVRFPRHRRFDQPANHAEKIITRAGVKQWPKLWQNLRASGCTDFARSLPSHIAAAICGHTEQIAQEHYWTVTDTDLDSAMRKMPTVPEVKAEAEKSRNNPQEGENHASGFTSDAPDFPEKLQNPLESEGNQWAILDSNQRPPRCQRGALTN